MPFTYFSKRHKKVTNIYNFKNQIKLLPVTNVYLYKETLLGFPSMKGNNGYKKIHRLLNLSKKFKG